MPASKSTHAFRLDAGHPEEVLSVGEIGGKLGKLRMQLSQLSLFEGAARGSHGLALGGLVVGVHAERRRKWQSEVVN